MIVNPFGGVFSQVWSSPSGGNGSGFILLDDNWDSLIHADYSLVGTPDNSVGNPITDALSVSGPYDWNQPSSGARPVIDNTSFSGGRLSMKFDGATQWFTDDLTGLAALYASEDAPFLRHLHMVMLPSGTNTTFAALGSDTNTTYELLRRNTGGTPTQLKEQGYSGLAEATGSTYANGSELVIAQIRHTDQTFSMWVNGTKELNKAAWDATVSTAFVRAILGGWVNAGGPTTLSTPAVRSHGYRSAWTGDGDLEAAALYAECFGL